MAVHSLVNTTFPVLLPEMPELRMEKAEFEAHTESLLQAAPKTENKLPIRTADETKASGAVKDEAKPTAGGGDLAKVTEPEAPFMTALLADKTNVPSLDEHDNKMLTENADVAYRTTKHPLVDLFYELEDVVSSSRLKEVLEKAWENDAEATLKIIFNARSIHLGKSSRPTFYRAAGWLAENHPITLLSNLPFLVRPVIPKKASKPEDKKDGEVAKDAEMVDAKDADSDFEIVDEEGQATSEEPKLKKLKVDEDAELAEFDIKYGVSHGYWKDLLNLVALAASDQLKVDGDPSKILNVERPATKKKYMRDWTQGKKKATNTERHERVVKKLEEGGFYRALHATVARIFANQLKLDLERLNSGSRADKKRITPAAKWAPTHKGMHDQHSCIVSTIAELLYPFDKLAIPDVDPADRELYLKHARIAYQSQTLSPLRKHLEIVERPITEEKFNEIKYDRIPSLAMKQYTPLFAKKDMEGFEAYIERVASGKAKISGATLLPSTLVASVLDQGDIYSYLRKSKQDVNDMIQKKIKDIYAKAADGQWNTLVQRIRDSGKLENSIAVCDVSGSMFGPEFKDGTAPIHSSIGLSLLLAEITKPPFGGAFITFSHEPQVVRIGGAGDKRPFRDKVQHAAKADWGGDTDFVAVFEKLILPMAIENKVSQEDMVKQLFVFSDMQFNSANHDRSNRWSTSFERIQKKYKEAGYEMPRLIFWNLAGGRSGYGQLDDEYSDDEIAPKPVDAEETNTALVSGYSQGQLKMFLEGGGFEEEEEEVTVEEKAGEEGEDEECEVVVKKEKKKQNPLDVVKRAISHDAYRMLKVVD